MIVKHVFTNSVLLYHDNLYHLFIWTPLGMSMAKFKYYHLTKNKCRWSSKELNKFRNYYR